jgi:hypothetical protein
VNPRDHISQTRIRAGSLWAQPDGKVLITDGVEGRDGIPTVASTSLSAVRLKVISPSVPARPRPRQTCPRQTPKEIVVSWRAGRRVYLMITSALVLAHMPEIAPETQAPTEYL